MNNHARYETNVAGRKASTSIISSVRDHDRIDLQEQGLTLFDFVDLDALDQLFAHTSNADLSVQFTVQDATVIVSQSDGQIETRIVDEKR